MSIIKKKTSKLYKKISKIILLIDDNNVSFITLI